MADDTSKRGPADGKRVNVNESWEVQYWGKKFDSTEDQLRAAVKAVGTMAIDVEKHLKKK